MKMVTLRFFVTLIVILGAALGLASPAWAQACDGAAAAGAVAAVAPVIALAADGIGPIGDNLVGIPAFSPVNDNPTNAFTNGFQQLCDIFGLRGTRSQISQFNAQAGRINTFVCNQLTAPPFQPCQGVLIRPTIAAAAAIPVGGGGVEGSWSYGIYGLGGFPKGYHIFSVPLTMEDVNGDGDLDPEDICLGLGLIAGSEVIEIQATTGNYRNHACGMDPLFTLTPGEGVLIRSGCAAAGVLCGFASMPIL